MSRRMLAIARRGALLALLTSAVAAHAQDPGQATYTRWCAPCHAAGPGHPGTQALAAKYRGDRPDALEARTDLTPDLVRYFVRHGVSVMPFFRKTEISDDELAALSGWLARPR